MERKRERQKVLIIGLDGGTFRVIKPFVEEGLLPSIASLMKNGSYGILESTIPPVTAPAWASFLTGKNPGKHGIYQFFEFKQGEYQTQYNFYEGKLINFDQIYEPTIFEILGEARKVVSINMPLTYPPRKINGCMISDWLTPPGSNNYTFPPELLAEIPDYRIDQYFGEKSYVIVPSGKEIDAQYYFADINDVLEKRGNTALKLMREKEWDLFMVCFTETDRIQHFFWRSINPDYPEYDSEKVAKEREDFKKTYQHLDTIIGQLLKSAGDNTAIIAMSDHGFGPPAAKIAQLNYFLKQQGHLVLRKPQQVSSSIGLKPIVKRISPRLARILKRWGQNRNDQCEHPTVDWSKTVAWAINLHNNYGGIFINCKNRFSNGIVEFGSGEYENLLQQITSGLTNLRDDETGQLIVKNVQRREKLYHGPGVQNAPDLIVTLDPLYEAEVEGNFDITTENLISDYLPFPPGRGQHEREGIYIAYGNMFKNNGEGKAYTIEDILPTCLYLLNIPIPKDIDGKVLIDLIRPEYLARNPIDYQEPIPMRIQQTVQQDDEEIRKKLKQLGYL